MKFLALALLTSSVYAVEVDPCEENPLCTAAGKPCKAQDECCSGLGCFGYNFYKTCQEIPECLPEWYDCNNGIDCCDEVTVDGETKKVVCAETECGKMECQIEDFGTKDVDLPDGDVRGPDEEDPDLTTTRGTDPVNYRKACVSGDPHIDSFDGLSWDCMGHGEYIIMKSQLTRRQVQGRFQQLENEPFTNMVGVVIQDEGDVPLVQFSFSQTKEGSYHTLGGTWEDGWDPNKPTYNFECPLQMFVDGTQVDMYHYRSEHFTLEVYNDRYLQLKYVQSEMEVRINIDYWHGCMLGTCYHIPQEDDPIGLVGTPDGNAMNDWMNRDGESLGPDTTEEAKLRWDAEYAYNYCTTNWCIRERSDSLFTYNEVGYLFGNYMRCDLLPNTMLAEDIIEGITPEIEVACEGDMDCYMDYLLSGNLENAVATLQLRKDNLADTCNFEGGECSISACCDGLTCVDRGTEGNVCVSNIGDDFCMTGTGNCNFHDCCEGAVCIDYGVDIEGNTRKRCQSSMDCKLANGLCSADSDCCDSLACVGPDGSKKCKTVGTAEDGGTCLLQWDMCNFGMDCCDGSLCLEDTDFAYRCMPDTCRELEEDCSELACCDGLECSAYGSRMLCFTPPTCVKDYGDCDGTLGCCDPGYTCDTVELGDTAGTNKCLPSTA